MHCTTGIAVRVVGMALGAGWTPLAELEGHGTGAAATGNDTAESDDDEDGGGSSNVGGSGRAGPADNVTDRGKPLIVGFMEPVVGGGTGKGGGIPVPGYDPAMLGGCVPA